MKWNFYYRLYETEWTIYFRKYWCREKAPIFTTMYASNDDLIQKNRPMSERLISAYYGIPKDQLKSEIYEYESQLLHYMNSLIAKFQTGRLTPEQFEKDQETLLSSYRLLFMNDLYYQVQKDKMDDDRKKFEERRHLLTQEKATQPWD